MTIRLAAKFKVAQMRASDFASRKAQQFKEEDRGNISENILWISLITVAVVVVAGVVIARLNGWAAKIPE